MQKVYVMDIKMLKMPIMMIMMMVGSANWETQEIQIVITAIQEIQVIVGIEEGGIHLAIVIVVGIMRGILTMIATQVFKV